MLPVGRCPLTQGQQALKHGGVAVLSVALQAGTVWRRANVSIAVFGIFARGGWNCWPMSNTEGSLGGDREASTDSQEPHSP